MRSELRYLGFLLDQEGLRLDPERVAPVINYPAPRSVKEFRRFLGMVGWYARFIKSDAEKKVPLVRLLQKGRAWEWGDEPQEAFDELKQALARAPVLARPDFSRPFAIQCDASDNAIGAGISQELDDGEHLIVYASRVLTPAERNYSVTEKKCLAVLWAILKFHLHHEGNPFTVITDHSALKWLRNLKEPTGHLAR